MDQQLHYAFVYGTLKSGEPNHHLLDSEKITFCGRATSERKFPLVIASRYNIPYALDAPGTGNHIQGEIYEVDSETLVGKLDKLENHPIYYTRTEEEFVLTKESKEKSQELHVGCRVKAYIYLLKNYRDELLQLKPFLISYDGKTSDKKYIKPSERKSCEPYYSDVQNV